MTNKREEAVVKTEIELALSKLNYLRLCQQKLNDVAKENENTRREIAEHMQIVQSLRCGGFDHLRRFLPIERASEDDLKILLRFMEVHL